jgi:histidinol dehydrogenase
MLRILDVQTALQSILKRIPPDEMSVPLAILDGIQSVFGERILPVEAVRRILQDVRQKGDSALRYWSERLDGSAPDDFRVRPEDLSAALEGIPDQQREALNVMAERIEAFHRHQPLTSWITNDLGGTLGQWVRPIRRVGLYIPGGTAPLPSTVLMSAIPARVAGVSQPVIVAPPQRATGKISPIILAAAAVAGVSEVYTIGGAQAIAALAYGTESIPAVDKIFGPGNLFVTLAKQQVFGTVGIDGLAGPTETMIIADASARPAWVAADLLAQAEHDLLASAILLTPSRNLAEQVQEEIARQIEERSRAEIIVASFQNRGGVVITHDLWEAADLANRYAPEHLCLAVKDPWRLSERINAAGGVFMGEHSFEVLGDYVAGPSHVMPTGGSARYASPLNVWDFVHLLSLVALDPETAGRISQPAAVIAQAEHLDAHANAANFRLKDNP